MIGCVWDIDSNVVCYGLTTFTTTFLILLLRFTTISGNATESIRGLAFLVCAYLVMRRFLRAPLRFRNRIRLRPRLKEIAPIALLLLFASSNYLGLGTAGTFSMFSNIRTEGPVSNHWILGRNPLKCFGYQDDVVVVQEFPGDVPTIWRGMVKAAPRSGWSGSKLIDATSSEQRRQRIPLVQFRSLMYLARTNMRMRTLGPVRLVHNEVVHEFDDVMTSEFFAPTRRSWAMRLFAFRQIIDAAGAGAGAGSHDSIQKGLCMW